MRCLPCIRCNLWLKFSTFRSCFQNNLTFIFCFMFHCKIHLFFLCCMFQGQCTSLIHWKMKAVSLFLWLENLLGCFISILIWCSCMLWHLLDENVAYFEPKLREQDAKSLVADTFPRYWTLFCRIHHKWQTKSWIFPK